MLEGGGRPFDRRFARGFVGKRRQRAFPRNINRSRGAALGDFDAKFLIGENHAAKLCGSVPE